MDWFLYTLIAYFVLSAMCGVAVVGKPRPPIPAQAAAVLVLWYIGLAFGCYLTTR